MSGGRDAPPESVRETAMAETTHVPNVSHVPVYAVPVQAPACEESNTDMAPVTKEQDPTSWAYQLDPKTSYFNQLEKCCTSLRKRIVGEQVQLAKRRVRLDNLKSQLDSNNKVIQDQQAVLDSNNKVIQEQQAVLDAIKQKQQRDTKWWEETQQNWEANAKLNQGEVAQMAKWPGAPK